MRQHDAIEPVDDDVKVAVEYLPDGLLISAWALSAPSDLMATTAFCTMAIASSLVTGSADTMVLPEK
jgi:hypothetical protein